MGPRAWITLLCLASYSCCCCWGMEAELKCSACEAVATELQWRLDKELPREQLDLRHRLDKNGQRYGKVIKWKVSEIRAVNLLEDLCDQMDDWTLLTPGSSSGRAESNSTSDGQQQQQPRPAGWAKHKGEGAVAVEATHRPSRAEEELRKKQLTSFCGMLLESHEDQVVQALMSDQFADGVAPVLCQQITSTCKGKDYSSSTGSSGSSSSGQEAGQEVAQEEL